MRCHATVRRLLIASACVVVGLAAVPLAGAAQAIGVTNSPWSITVRGLEGGIVVGFPGLDGTRQHVTAKVTAPDSQRATLRYVYAMPAGTHQCRVPLPTRIPSSVTVGLWALRCDTVLLDGTPMSWLVQAFQKGVPDFGGDVATASHDIYISTWTYSAMEAGLRSWAHAGAGVTTTQFTLPPIGEQNFDGFPQLLAYPRWSKFSPGGYQGYLKGKHFPLLFGSFTFSGIGVYGPGNRFGSPTTTYGRNVYIDTFNSDYGTGWRRIMGVLTQPPNGTWCYELGPKGGSAKRTGISASNRYRLTAIGPGLTPVVRVNVTNPSFAFGGPTYDPRRDKWGYGFSDGQAQALRDQMAMIGPGYVTKPPRAGSTDCGLTLRQLPTPF